MLISIRPFKCQSTSCKQRTQSRMAMCSKTPHMTHFSLSRKSSQRTQPTTSRSTMQMKVKIGRLVVVYPSDDGLLSNVINIAAAKACWKSVLKLVSLISWIFWWKKWPMAWNWQHAPPLDSHTYKPIDVYSEHPSNIKKKPVKIIKPSRYLCF